MTRDGPVEAALDVKPVSVRPDVCVTSAQVNTVTNRNPFALI